MSRLYLPSDVFLASIIVVDDEDALVIGGDVSGSHPACGLLRDTLPQQEIGRMRLFRYQLGVTILLIFRLDGWSRRISCDLPILMAGSM